MPGLEAALNELRLSTLHLPCSTCRSPVGTFQLNSYSCKFCYKGFFQDEPGAPGKLQPPAPG